MFVTTNVSLTLGDGYNSDDESSNPGSVIAMVVVFVCIPCILFGCGGVC